MVHRLWGKRAMYRYRIHAEGMSTAIIIIRLVLLGDSQLVSCLLYTPVRPFLAGAIWRDDDAARLSSCTSRWRRCLYRQKWLLYFLLRKQEILSLAHGCAHITVNVRPEILEVSCSTARPRVPGPINMLCSCANIANQLPGFSARNARHFP